MGSIGSTTSPVEIGGWLTPEQSVRVLGVLDWLERELEPHIAWEESWLYPEIDARTGTPWATRAARFDHGQIRDVAHQAASRQAASSSRIARATGCPSCAATCSGSRRCSAPTSTGRSAS